MICKKRKILFSNGMSNDMMLIITDAPSKVIEKWCYDYNKGIENGVNIYFDTLKENYYVKVLHDSELENNNNNVEKIGYDESYDLNEYI